MWTAETIPPELAAILDEQAGNLHSPTGSVRSCLADILNRYDELRDDAACALAEEALAAENGAGCEGPAPRSDMGRCPQCKTTIIRFDPPIEVKVDETELCGAFKPGAYGVGIEVPVCLLERGHLDEEPHWGVVEYETRWTHDGTEWPGKTN